MVTRRVLLLLGIAMVATLTAAATTESAKVVTNAVDKTAEASTRSAVGGDRLAKATTRTVPDNDSANTVSTLALASLSSKAATTESHLIKVTSGADLPVKTASRMATEVALPSRAGAAAAAAEVTDKDSQSLATTTSRLVEASSVDAIIRRVTASSQRDAVIKVVLRLALAYLGKSQVRDLYHVVMISNKLWYRASLYNVIYSDVWTFRSTPFRVLIFGSGTLYHTPAPISSFGFNSKSAKQTTGKVEFYRLF
ncbi:hypothetical protein MMPV_005603 [Pyropia vietnamensis]